MTEQEKLMYKILGNISAANSPIVFKGALITKLILAEHGFEDVERITNDIDGNWIDTPPSMIILADTINQSLGDLKSKYYAAAIREYGEKKSAGISIIEKNTNDRIILMDISIKPVIGSKIYHYGEAKIKGVLVDEIISDKISVLSGNYIFRRTKDMIDVYALSSCVDFQTKEIFDIYEKTKREINSFDAFLTRKSDLEHAYNKLKGVEGKPDFANIYFHLDNFLRPFIEKDCTNKIWKSTSALWRDL